MVFLVPPVASHLSLLEGFLALGQRWMIIFSWGPHEKSKWFSAHTDFCQAVCRIRTKITFRKHTVHLLSFFSIYYTDVPLKHHLIKN